MSRSATSTSVTGKAPSRKTQQIRSKLSAQLDAAPPEDEFETEEENTKKDNTMSYTKVRQLIFGQAMRYVSPPKLIFCSRGPIPILACLILNRITYRTSPKQSKSMSILQMSLTLMMKRWRITLRRIWLHDLAKAIFLR